MSRRSPERAPRLSGRRHPQGHPLCGRAGWPGPTPGNPTVPRHHDRIPATLGLARFPRPGRGRRSRGHRPHHLPHRPRHGRDRDQPTQPANPGGCAAKSDPLDAEQAARTVISGEASTTPKDHTGVVESIRVLRVARTGAVKARTAALNQLKDLLTTAPEPLRTRFRGLTLPAAARACTRLRPDHRSGSSDQDRTAQHRDTHQTAHRGDHHTLRATHHPGHRSRTTHHGAARHLHRPRRTAAGHCREQPPPTPL